MDNKLSKAAKSSSNKDLPNEIIYEIQLRLPLKSLIRFCCASKGWHRTIISDTKFGKSHFELASQQQTLRRRLLIASPEPPSFEEIHEIRSIPFPKLSTLRIHPITLGSCNGLVCLHYPGWDICLWNPTTNKVQSLPLPSPPRDFERTKIDISGFGYVSDTDDYKLVLRSELDGEYVVDIFSLRNKSWKRKRSPRLPGVVVTCSSGNCVYLNQVLHWPQLAERSRWSGKHKSVLAFDLVEEEFRDIEVPYSPRHDDAAGRLSIGVLSEGRCLCVAEINLEFIKTWVMREYNVPDSWSNFSYRIYIPFTEEVFFSESYIYVKNSIFTESYLRRLDLDEDEFHVHGDGLSSISQGFTMIQYDESLLQIDDYLNTI